MEKNKNNTVVTVSEDTKEIYELHKELIMLREKLDSWYEKTHGCPSNEECNVKIMDKFTENSYCAFDTADKFIMELLTDNIKENVYNEKDKL